MNKPALTDTAIEVLIIGGGPAGLSAAIELKRLGVSQVVVLDREAQTGGIPRHCGHPPFGVREFKRLMTGPQYARRLSKAAIDAGVEVRTSTTVTALKPGGIVYIKNNEGVSEITAKRVIYATGVRETPRAARFISGSRPTGVINTGALQSMVYLKHRRPFSQPVILGTELVSFSAIQTCLHAGIKPLAMIEPQPRVTTYQPATLFARFKRIPIIYNIHDLGIEGQRTIEAIHFRTAEGTSHRIECDGLIVSGQFTPESSLARCGHMEIDPGTKGPRVDQYGRCSDPAYYAAGNILRPVETAGWSWDEGRQIARNVADDLAGRLPQRRSTIQLLTHEGRLKYFMPQEISATASDKGMQSIQLRLSEPYSGHLCAYQSGALIWRKRLNSRPERRVFIPISALYRGSDTSPIELTLE